MQNETKVSDLYVAAFWMAAGCGVPNGDFLSKGRKVRVRRPGRHCVMAFRSVVTGSRCRRRRTSDAGQALQQCGTQTENRRESSEEARTRKGSYENGKETTTGARDS